MEQDCCFDAHVQIKTDKNFISEDRLVEKSLGTMDHRGLLKYYQVSSSCSTKAKVTIVLQRVIQQIF